MLGIGTGKSQVVVISGNYHVRDIHGDLINLNSREGADLVLGLWEYIDTLEARDRKKASRRSRGRPRKDEVEDSDE